MNITETRQRLSDYHSFAVLVWNVVQGHRPRSDEIYNDFNSMSDFLRTASSHEIREREKEFEEVFKHIVRISKDWLPPRKELREIARDFRLLTKSEPSIWRFGIEHGWLADRFDLSNLRQAEDLPRHARIGIGVHSGRVSVEEASLLEDTFFLLVRARNSFEALKHHAHSSDKKTVGEKHQASYQVLSALNGSVCTYSRLGVLTAVAFVEAFVNSIGWNEAAMRPLLSEQEKAELHGTRKGRYLSLESKIERFPRIIRADSTSPIILSDPIQMREPFSSFLNEAKGARDASMHYAPGKAPILHPPQEWLSLVESATKNAVAVAREFWSACYPGRLQPRYLASLYYKGLLQQALDRLSSVGAETAQDVPAPSLSPKLSD